MRDGTNPFLFDLDGGEVIPRFPNLLGAMAKDDHYAPGRVIPRHFLGFDGTKTKYFDDTLIVHANHNLIPDGPLARGTNISILAIARINMDEYSNRVLSDPYFKRGRAAARRMLQQACDTPMVIAVNLQYHTREIPPMRKTATDVLMARYTMDFSSDSFHVRFVPPTQHGSSVGPTMIAVRAGQNPAYLWVPPSHQIPPTLEYFRVSGTNGGHFVPYFRNLDNSRIVKFLGWLGETSLTVNGFTNASDEVRFLTEFPDL